MTGRAYVGEMSPLCRHKFGWEINVLFDKQVNVQKKSLKKNLWGSLKLPQAHQKSVQ